MTIYNYDYCSTTLFWKTRAKFETYGSAEDEAKCFDREEEWKCIIREGLSVQSKFSSLSSRWGWDQLSLKVVWACPPVSTALSANQLLNLGLSVLEELKNLRAKGA